MKFYFHEIVAALVCLVLLIVWAIYLPEQLVNALIPVAYIGFSVLVGRAAPSYLRSATAWFFLSIAASPPVAWLFLLVADVPHSAVLAREKEKAVRERHPDLPDVREVAQQETACGNCGAPVNPVTGEGLHSPELEPWRLLCDRCRAEVKVTP